VLLGGLQKTTLIDYPGKIACTVFLTGCNFRCPWCYNPELVFGKHEKITEKYFFEFLKERKGLLEGVVVCGGEPTINKNLSSFLKKIKKMGYAVKLDTNGSNPAMLEKLIQEKLLDYIAMDIKAPLKTSNYGKAAGARVDLAKIKKSIGIIKKSGVDYEFRTTFVPKLLSDKDIVNIAKTIKGSKIYFIQQFKPGKTISPKYGKYKPLDQKQLKAIKKECEKYLPTETRD